jgi:hypothetical protein
MKMRIKAIVFSLMLAAGVFFTSAAYAQCSLCTTNVKSAVGSNTKKAGLGLNPGIMMLLIMPYAIVGVIGVLWYMNRKPDGGRGSL